MKKKLIFLIMLCFGYTYADTVNWVVARVNNEPITNFEVYDLMKKTNKNQASAIEFLIDEKLQDADIKKLDIAVSPHEVTQRINHNLKNSNLTLDEFIKGLNKSGMDYNIFREELAKNLKKEKYLEMLFVKADQKITPKSIRAFYENNRHLFTSFDSIKVTRFVSNNPNSLENLRQGENKAKDIKSQKITIKKSDLNPQTLTFLSSLANGDFTPIIQFQPNLFETLKVEQKIGIKMLDFDEAKENAAMRLAEIQRKRVLSEHFEKLRAESVIEFLKAK
ncbi:peptidyl-prolyl cis-trans isomerase [Campylobacter sp. FMV-PI01]|uniref:Peptidyl-prolyl cis-trans isomerase n=1 Tax=Campylobacter portucalensis TaxID=2608384 RepID=A0A6L5WIU1_9BACT|nr:peptidylprolyl isomerase [Campylobacter portucalensis]MSN95915.1 peptidyl-prolyl cis-trans isomerase [Campylobacter portucalensis]